VGGPRGLRKGGRSDRCEGEILISHHMRRFGGPQMGQAKPHIGGGPEAQVPIIQHKRNYSNTPAVPTLATIDVETRAKLGEE
jgi:hypothetical protein